MELVVREGGSLGTCQGEVCRCQVQSSKHMGVLGG